MYVSVFIFFKVGNKIDLEMKALLINLQHTEDVTSCSLDSDLQLISLKIKS